MKWTIRIVMVLAFMAVSNVAVAEPLVGRASVIDGDTIEIRGQRVRLFGVDAPESRQLCQDALGKSYRCGQRAAFALDAMVQGRTVYCDDRGRDRYKRLISVCRVSGVDLGEAMVRDGMAIAYRRYSTNYVGAERMAAQNGTGLWQGVFEAPWEWRKR